MLRSFAQAYLVAFVFWLGLPLGATFFLALHRLTGGRWGHDLARALHGSAATMPSMAVFFLPLLLLLPQLYPWLPDSSATHGQLLNPHPLYLSRAAFTARALVYFCVWVFFAWRLRRPERGGRGVAALAILALFISTSLAAVDWLMSLDPAWYSSVYGLMVLTGAGVSALALAVYCSAYAQARAAPPANADHPDQSAPARALGDLSTLLLVTLMCWAYAHFSQLIIMWSGNKPEEMAWYTARFHGTWRWVAWLLILGAFVLPFLLLLFRRLKRHATTVMAIAGVIIAGQMAAVYWLIVPSFGPHFGPSDGSLLLWTPLPMAAIGLPWLWGFRRLLRSSRGGHYA